MELPYKEKFEMAEDILKKGKDFGADIIGFADIDSLRNGPSETLFPRMEDKTRDHFAQRITTGLPHGRVLFEEDAVTAVVFGVAHPKEKPEMDWWHKGSDPEGNKLLIKVGKALKEYINQKYPAVNVYPKAYHVEKGGLYLKEAACQAGLGCIGKNNLFICPEFGPAVRLRAMLISERLPAGGPSAFDPCKDCDAPCLKSCPQKAFDRILYTKEETGLGYLPARDGNYSRKQCGLEMAKNEAEVADETTKYCRNCELACPIGTASKLK